MTRRERLDAIARQRDLLLRLDHVVDDCRRAIEDATADLKTALLERDQAAQELTFLISTFADVEETTIP